MTYNQKKNRLLIVVSYAIVHRISFADAIAIFGRALDVKIDISKIIESSQINIKCTRCGSYKTYQFLEFVGCANCHNIFSESLEAKDED